LDSGCDFGSCVVDSGERLGALGRGKESADEELCRLDREDLCDAREDGWVELGGNVQQYAPIEGQRKGRAMRAFSGHAGIELLGACQPQ
jgi:hypothetical protein